MFTIRSAACIKFITSYKYLPNFFNFSSSPKRVPKRLTNYYSKFQCEQNLRLFPDDLLRITYRSVPKNQYIAVDSEAIKIADAIKSKQIPNVPLLEVYPGPGILTKYLAKLNVQTLFLYENQSYFLAALKRSLTLNSDVNIKLYDATDAWNFASDAKSIESLSKRMWNEEIVGQAFMIAPSLENIQNLCTQIILQSGVFSRGRIEFFVALPATDYIKLTCGPNCGYVYYRARSVIFQILFEHEYLFKIDRCSFLPWYLPRERQREPYVNATFESDHFYLIRIVPRKDLLSYCDNGDLSALSYFVCQLFSKRKSWIIPKLEKWIPGCGASLICNTSPAKSSQPLHLSTDFSHLPKFSRPCMTLTVDDHFTTINTFTECGELTPEQMFTLFYWFKNLPQYSTCDFIEKVADYFTKPFGPALSANKFKRVVRKS